MRSGSTWLGAAGVFALAIALRLPFAGTVLFAWDSILYARAIERFAVALDPLEARPHAPGYLFYVLAARAATAFLGDANAGLVLASALGGALACAAGFVVGAHLGGRWVGAGAAALLLANPLLWQYSAIAYPYAVLAGLAAAVGYWLWRARTGGLAGRLLASAGLGLAAGFRQDLFIVLGPLWLFVVASGGRRAAVASAAAVFAASLAWLVPTALASGGVETYFATWLAQTGLATGSGDEGASLARNAAITAGGLAAQLIAAWPLAFVGAWMILRRGRTDLGALFALWVLPALLFYVAAHIGSWGYTLSVSVPIAVLAALGADAIAAAAGKRARPAVAIVVAGLVALSAAYFLAGDGQFTAHEIRARDRKLGERLAYVRERHAPSEVAVLAEPGFMHVVHYLPEYAAVLVPTRPSPETKPLALPSRAQVAVLFDDELRLDASVPVRRVRVAEGELRVVDLPAGARLVLRDGVLRLAGPD